MNRQPRGRPRAFDKEQVLDRALELFWSEGFEATSLDDIAAAAGIARPSLFAALGNKDTIYIKTMERFSANMRGVFDEAFGSATPLPKALKRFYRRALDIYVSGAASPRGCLVLCTAPAVGARYPAIRCTVASLVHAGDRAFEDVFRRARERGELAATADPAGLAVLASATLQTLAVRARAGEPRRKLERLLNGAVAILCGG
jgi:AcrR family transcriptional regulator